MHVYPLHRCLHQIIDWLNAALAPDENDLTAATQSVDPGADGLTCHNCGIDGFRAADVDADDEGAIEPYGFGALASLSWNLLCSKCTDR